MAFNGNMANDEAYVNGIGRFEIQVNDAAAEVTWSQSKYKVWFNIESHRVDVQTFGSQSPKTILYKYYNFTMARKDEVTFDHQFLKWVAIYYEPFNSFILKSSKSFW